MNKIQKNLNDYMSNPYANISYCGKFNVMDFNNLTKVLNNTDEDFLIMDNAGGKRFDIFFDMEDLKVEIFIKKMLKTNKSYVFCYQINKKQTIIKELV